MKVVGREGRFGGARGKKNLQGGWKDFAIIHSRTQRSVLFTLVRFRFLISHGSIFIFLFFLIRTAAYRPLFALKDPWNPIRHYVHSD